MTTLTPAAAADRTGVSIDTLRYYEREGLIGPVRRSTGGRREYTEEDVFWIGLVTCFREAGLGIADLRGSSPSCAASTLRRTGSPSFASAVPPWNSGWRHCAGPWRSSTTRSPTTAERRGLRTQLVPYPSPSMARILGRASDRLAGAGRLPSGRDRGGEHSHPVPRPLTSPVTPSSQNTNCLDQMLSQRPWQLGGSGTWFGQYARDLNDSHGSARCHLVERFLVRGVQWVGVEAAALIHLHVFTQGGSPAGIGGGFLA